MTTNNRTEILLEFFTYLDTCNVEYCVVGDPEKLPQIIPSDIDIVIYNKDLINIHNIVSSFAQTHQLQFPQVLQHEQTCFYFVLSFRNNEEKIEYLHPDICGDYFRNGKLFVTAQALLADRQKALTKSGEDKGFYVPSPPMEFLYYLIKKIDKGILENKHLDHLRDQFSQDPEQCERNIAQLWAPAEVKNIINCLKLNDLATLRRILPQLQQVLSRKCRPTLQQKWLELQRKVSRVIHPTGLVVGLLGPDGCGKSTVGDLLIEELKPVFRGVSRFHLRPDLFGRKKHDNGQVVVDPHGEKARGLLMSICKLFFFLTEYLGGYLLKIRPLQVRSHLVVFDRYFHDILIDPIRYRFGAPMWLARFCSLFIPEPDLFIIFDAPADIINGRKQEVPLAETERQREAYLAFAQNKGNCIVINTDQPIANSVADVCGKVLNYMEDRLQARTGVS